MIALKHSLGKGEAESSNLSSSTTKPPAFQGFCGRGEIPHAEDSGRTENEPEVKAGEFPGTLFAGRSGHAQNETADRAATRNGGNSSVSNEMATPEPRTAPYQRPVTDARGCDHA